jgi:outer membrane lipoprotein-sorting protein
VKWISRQAMFLSVLLLSVLFVAPVRAIDGPEVIGRVQKQFDKLKTLSARFEKRHFWKLVDQTQSVKGELHVEKPNRFRLESEIRTVVTDGKTAWSYDPLNEQVLMNDYTSVEGDRSYEKLLFDLVLLGGYEERFSPTYVGEEKVRGKRTHVVDLRAIEQDAYIETVRLWIDRKEWLVRQIEYQNINGDITTYELDQLKKNKKPKEGLFQFTAPPGVEVVDLR